MLNGLDLFSGIGGLTVALSEWVRPIAYCEIEPYCQGVLLSRMATRDIQNAPIWDDITSFPLESFTGEVDIIYGGFPCQDISVAGHGKGLEGKRSGLFFEILRLAKEIKPSFIFLENVPAITTRGGLDVVRSIAQMGYDCRWCVISAASIGALHRRERWFLLAYSKHNGTFTSEEGRSIRECATQRKESDQQKESIRKTERASGISSNVAHSCGEGLEGQGNGAISTIEEKSKSSSISDDERIKKWQETVSKMGKCSDGISNHVDRLRALGNAVVPEQAKEAFKILMGLK